MILFLLINLTFYKAILIKYYKLLYILIYSNLMFFEISSLNLSLDFSSSISNIGIAVLPIPCSFKISVTENFESLLSVVISAFSNARRAGAESNERKSSFGLLVSSQIGQVGQSELL